MSDRREPPEGQKPRSSSFGPAYQGAAEAAFAVVIAMGLGAVADYYLGSSPVGLFVGLGIGFGSFVLRLTRLMKELSSDASAAGKDGKRPDDGE